MLHLSAASKTFLLGEYLALKGGPAILANTEPRFSLSVQKAEQHQVTGIYPESPAGLFIAAHANIFSDHRIQFNDPHHSLGGFGASSAQFLLVYAAHHELNQEQILQLNATTIEELLQHYQHLATKKHALAPSGADIISQWAGSITYFDKTSYTVQSMAWPFDDIGFCLIHTGHKIDTHKHLHELSTFPTQALHDCVQEAHRALLDHNSQVFITAVTEYGNQLATLKFLAKPSQHLLQQLQQQAFVLTAKGCGALGADVLLIILQQQQKAQLQQWLKKQGLKWVADETDLSPGMTTSLSEL